VLLFHDDSPVTPRALERLLPEWKAAGLTFARLPGWEAGR
jgi:peptidoglycan/xylan/chitin deacetylase (PgdA/CDA1 family)